MNSLATLGCVTALTLSSLSAHAMCTPEDAQAKAEALAAKVKEVGENDPQRAAQINAELESMKVERNASEVPDECAMYDQRLREFEAADKLAD